MGEHTVWKKNWCPNPLDAAVCYSLAPLAAVVCRIIEELDTEIDGAVTGLQLATKRSKEFMKKHGGARWCCFITFLISVLALLTFLVLFT